MGKLLERLKRGREKLKARVSQTKAKLEIRRAIKAQKLQGEKIEAKAKIGKRIKEFEERQERINKIREIQLKKAKIEAEILKAKAQKAKSQRQITGAFPKLKISVKSRPKVGGLKPRIAQRAPPRAPAAISMQPQRVAPGGALMDFGRPKPIIKKKAPTPGLGRFRVL